MKSYNINELKKKNKFNKPCKKKNKYETLYNNHLRRHHAVWHDRLRAEPLTNQQFNQSTK